MALSPMALGGTLKSNSATLQNVNDSNWHNITSVSLEAGTWILAFTAYVNKAADTSGVGYSTNSSTLYPSELSRGSTANNGSLIVEVSQTTNMYVYGYAVYSGSFNLTGSIQAYKLG